MEGVYSPALAGLGQQDLYILVGHPEMEIALVVQIAGLGTLAQRAGKTSQRDIEPVSPALRQLLCRPIPAVLQQVKDLFAQVRSPVEQGRKNLRGLPGVVVQRLRLASIRSSRE